MKKISQALFVLLVGVGVAIGVFWGSSILLGPVYDELFSTGAYDVITPMFHGVIISFLLAFVSVFVIIKIKFFNRLLTNRK